MSIAFGRVEDAGRLLSDITESFRLVTKDVLREVREESAGVIHPLEGDGHDNEEDEEEHELPEADEEMKYLEKEITEVSRVKRRLCQEAKIVTKQGLYDHSI